MPSDASSAFALIIQGGSFALLAYLIIVGLPKGMKSYREERDADRKSSIEAAHACTETQEKLVGAFQEEAKFERMQCANQFDRMMESLAKNQANIELSFRTVSDQVRTHHEFAQASIVALRDASAKAPA